MLDALGEQFASGRQQWCGTNQLGLTDFYNALHESDRDDSQLASLRVMLTDIDCALRVAYGWPDLDLEHGFHEVASLPANDRVRFTISEAARLEVLRRLSVLNRGRYQGEQSAARSLEVAQAERAAPRKRTGRLAAKKAAAATAQPQLFD